MEELDPEVYMDRPYLVFDLETTNLDKGFAGNPLNDVVAAAWYRPEFGKVHYHRGGIFDQATLLADIEAVLREGGFLVAHNAKFDIQWLFRMGIDPYKVFVYDTMIGEYVLAGNRRWKLGLGEVAKRYGMAEGKAPFVDMLMKGGICPSEMPAAYIRARAIRDVKQTLKIFRSQRRALVKQKKLAVHFTRCIVTPVLAHIEMQGLKVNAKRTYEEYSKAQMDLGIATAEFNELFGEVNPRSTKDMGTLIYGTLGFAELTRYGGKPIRNKPNKAFPGGAPKVDTKTLDKLKATNHKQREFLRLRKEISKKDAALTKTLEFFKGTVEEYGGIFYGQFNQTVTQTHRLSSSARSRYFEQYDKNKGIQLQNMPGAFKDLIEAKQEGYKVADADGSQLEFRVAAFLGQDTKAIYNIRHDVDQHVFTARTLMGLSLSEWDALPKEKRDKLRKNAKPDTFKPLYGGTRGTPEQERYYAAFREEFPELAETQEGWTYTVLSKLKLALPWGQVFHWPFTRQDERTGYIDNTHTGGACVPVVPRAPKRRSHHPGEHGA
jgi:DNA polymerase I-like protein with 3'-5' exonuclease and polymerase domains